MRSLICTLLLVAVCPLAADAALKSQTIEYKDGDVNLKGYLVYDDAVEGKRPGVLVVHEWWGLNDYARKRAEMLAGQGYVAFAVDMYGEGKVTEHPMEAGKWASEIRANQEAWLQRAKAGLNVLKSHELVDSEKLAAIGYCFGGSTVLQMAYHGFPLDAVVSFHGALPVPTEEQVKQIKGEILICHGADDAFIPQETVNKVRTALKQGGADFRIEEYPGARHSFTVPNADEKGIENIKYDKKADEKSWQSMTELFKKQLK